MGVARMMTTPLRVSGRCFIPPPYRYVHIGSCPENALLAMVNSSFSHHTLCQVPVLENQGHKLQSVLQLGQTQFSYQRLHLWVLCPCPP